MKQTDLHKSPAIYFITGMSGSGKTTFMQDLSLQMKLKGLKPGGFVAPGTWLNNRRDQFTLIDLETGLELPLTRPCGDSAPDIGRFCFDAATIDYGNTLLIKQSSDLSFSVIFVDEVGPFELKQQGWYQGMQALLTSQTPQIWSVRENLVPALIDQWHLTPMRILSPAQLPGKILGQMMLDINIHKL